MERGGDDRRVDDGGMAVTLAVTRSIRERMGARLEEMGYTLVEVTWDEDSGEPRLEEEVDCLFFSLDFFKAVPSDLTREQHERRRAVGRDLIVPRVRHWVHVPSAGLNHWQDIFASTRLATTEQRRGEEAGADRTLILTHGAGVMGLPMGEYCVSHILYARARPSAPAAPAPARRVSARAPGLTASRPARPHDGGRDRSIAKRIPLHIDMQREQRWEKVTQRGLSNDVLGILGCGGAWRRCTAGPPRRRRLRPTVDSSAHADGDVAPARQASGCTPPGSCARSARASWPRSARSRRTW